MGAPRDLRGLLGEYFGAAAERFIAAERDLPDRPAHEAAACAPDHCPFHDPSDHHMKEWRRVVRASGLVERRCPHGVGHPDPDSVAYMARVTGHRSWGVHGCDGCCFRAR